MHYQVSVIIAIKKKKQKVSVIIFEKKQKQNSHV